MRLLQGCCLWPRGVRVVPVGTRASARGAARGSWQGTGAEDPVLTSKITAPGVPGWAVQRPRISKLIAQGARTPLTVITGAPGAGKTMALALWADAHSGASAWVTMSLRRFARQASPCRGAWRPRRAGAPLTMRSC